MKLKKSITSEQFPDSELVKAENIFLVTSEQRSVACFENGIVEASITCSDALLPHSKNFQHQMWDWIIQSVGLYKSY